MQLLCVSAYVANLCHLHYFVRATARLFDAVRGTRWRQINAAAEVIYANVDPTANIIFGALVDERMEGEMSITVLATGFQTQVCRFVCVLLRDAEPSLSIDS